MTQVGSNLPGTEIPRRPPVIHPGGLRVRQDRTQRPVVPVDAGDNSQLRKPRLAFGEGGVLRCGSASAHAHPSDYDGGGPG